MKTDPPLPDALPEGWYLSDPEEASRLQRELEVEIPTGHLLDGLIVDVIAHRDGTDDVLCRHRADPSRFTVVHLSWRMKREIDTKHPTVECDGVFDDFLAYEAAFFGR